MAAQMGLAIARRALLAHGGDLSAANAPQGGARFVATLPVTPSGIWGNSEAAKA